MKNYSKAKDIEQIQVDFLEQLVRSVVDTTISEVVLKPKTENVDNKWKEAIKLINDNNEITRLLKSDVRQKSKYGKSYVGFDMFEGKPILWVAPYSHRNTALRLNGMKQFAVRVIREYSAIKGNTPILRNEVTYTDKERFYLFLGGFGVGSTQGSINDNMLNKVQAKKDYIKAKEKQLTFPFDYVSLQTPKYVLEQNLSGKVKHNLGVLQAMEMLNKDVSDYEISDEYLSDWYPAQDYIPLIAEYIKYIAWEMNLDHTRVIGMFSQQDLNNIQNQSKQIANSNDPRIKLERALERIANSRLNQALYDEDLSGEEIAIKKKLIIKALGGENNSIDVMNSQFDGDKHFTGLQHLVSLIYKICGYSWSAEDNAGTYENVSQTQNTLRSVYETTREKNELFTRQWKQLLTKVFFVLFDKQIPLEEIERDFDKNVDFKIVSNIIMNQNNDWRRIMELKNNNLLSTERAIKLIYPEMTDKEVKEEMRKINKQEQKAKFDNFNAFDNQKPFGSKPFNKEDEGVKDNE